MYKRKRRSCAPAVMMCIVSIFVLTFLLTSAGPKKEPRKPVIYASPVDAIPDTEHDPQAQDTGHSPDELPDNLRKLYDKVPEARDFVLGCLDSHEAPDSGDIDLSDLDLATVPDLHQWDTRWGYATYAGNFLGLSGCGPTCLSMAAIYLTGNRDLNPLYVAEYSTVNGHCYPGQGTAWTLFTDGAQGLGVTSRELPLAKAQIDSVLSGGGLVALVLGPGDFTDSGHFILLIGIQDGEYIIRDPNSPANTARTWSYEELEPQIRDLWSLT